VSYSTRLLWMRCGAFSLCLSKAISSAVISRPFKVMRDVLFSQQYRANATPLNME
jgi:hypothetical protein